MLDICNVNRNSVVLGLWASTVVSLGLHFAKIILSERNETFLRSDNKYFMASMIMLMMTAMMMARMKMLLIMVVMQPTADNRGIVLCFTSIQRHSFNYMAGW